MTSPSRASRVSEWHVRVGGNERSALRSFGFQTAKKAVFLGRREKQFVLCRPPRASAASRATISVVTEKGRSSSTSPPPKHAVRDGATTAAMESVMEWCREHKLRAIGGVWVTGMGASMAYNMTQKHLGPMTKLVHSRVYAQALTLGCLVVSAGAEYYDSKHNARTEDVDPYVYKAPMKAKGTH